MNSHLGGEELALFGLKTNAFYDSTVLHLELDGKSISANSRRYEVLEPSTATVLARSVDGRTLYVNATEEKKTVILEGSKRGVLTNQIYEGAMVLDPLASEFVQ